MRGVQFGAVSTADCLHRHENELILKELLSDWRHLEAVQLLPKPEQNGPIQGVLDRKSRSSYQRCFGIRHHKSRAGDPRQRPNCSTLLVQDPRYGLRRNAGDLRNVLDRRAYHARPSAHYPIVGSAVTSWRGEPRPGSSIRASARPHRGAANAQLHHHQGHDPAPGVKISAFRVRS